MQSPPIPQRIAPLRWRGPSFIWTPIALVIAIGWPLLFLADQPALQRVVLVAGAIVFAIALITLGASWALGRAPRTRRVVVLHVLMAGVIAAVAAPFAVTELLTMAANDGESFSSSMSMALTPLALVMGLPVALVSGMVFAWIALRRRRGEQIDENIFVANDVQPFR